MLAVAALNHELITWQKDIRLMAIYRNTTIVQSCHRDYRHKMRLQYSALTVAW